MSVDHKMDVAFVGISANGMIVVGVSDNETCMTVALDLCRAEQSLERALREADSLKTP